MLTLSILPAINCIESNANTNACITPEKREIRKNGIGTINGTKKIITIAIISHAIIFPNRRADIDTIFASSLIKSMKPRKISKSPIATAPGVRAFNSGQIFINQPTYLIGDIMIAAAFARMMTNKPRAMGRAK